MLFVFGRKKRKNERKGHSKLVNERWGILYLLGKNKGWGKFHCFHFLPSNESIIKFNAKANNILK